MSVVDESVVLSFRIVLLIRSHISISIRVDENGLMSTEIRETIGSAIFGHRSQSAGDCRYGPKKATCFAIASHAVARSEA